MTNKNVIAIVGDSGSGKTFASMYLQDKFGWKAIVSYTTRPMRNEERDGREHWFVSPSRKPSQEDMCAYTQFGGYEYWTEWEQFKATPICVYVIDEKGLINMMSKEQSPFNFNLITIKIKRTDKNEIGAERIARDKERTQLPDDFYDHIINNNGTLDEFRTALNTIAQNIKLKLNNGNTNK